MEAYTRMKSGRPVLCVNDAEILYGSWSNFAGVNNMGQEVMKFFNIKVDPECVQAISDYGLEAKWYERDGIYHLKCNLSWRFGDPEVYLIASNGIMTELTEQMVADLQNRRNIDHVDFEATKSFWKNDMNGTSGWSAYANSVHIYLCGPTEPERRYQERFGNTQQPEPVQMALFPDEDDIPF